MREIALHLLDLAENSVSAKARTVQVSVCEDMYADRLTASVEDDGCGMAPEMAAAVVDPFVTNRIERNVGLGIPLLKEAAEICNGDMQIASTPGIGTRIAVSFQHSHIDRMPLGDLPATFLAMTVAHPEVHWIFHYSLLPSNGEPHQVFEFDDQPFKEVMDGLPLTEPAVLSYLRSMFEEGIDAARQL